MTSDKYKFPKGEKQFNEFLVREYLKYSSVDEVYRKNRYNIPVSYAQYQRVLDAWGVIKAAGPNSGLAEMLEFFSHMVHENVPFEKLYKRLPPSFRTSTVTLYRILSYIKEGITRRVGTALVITPYDDRTKVLLAEDISTPRIELGKLFGCLSLPMGFSRKRNARKTNILRVLQQEVFTEDLIKRRFPNEIVNSNPEVFMYLDIADVRVSVYHIQLPKFLSKTNSFSSYKLKNYSFVDLEKIVNKKIPNLRMGVLEAAGGYKKYLEFLQRNLTVNPLQEKSLINKELAEVFIEVES